MYQKSNKRKKRKGKRGKKKKKEREQGEREKGEKGKKKRLDGEIAIARAGQNGLTIDGSWSSGSGGNMDSTYLQDLNARYPEGSMFNVWQCLLLGRGLKL